MNKIKLKTGLISLIVVIGLISCNSRYNETVFTDWDTNGDLKITPDEFDTYYGDGYFEAWDTDNSATISEAEWYEGLKVYYTGEEVDMTFEEANIGSADDLSKGEFRDATWILWDTDANGFLDRQEFGRWHYDPSRTE